MPMGELPALLAASHHTAIRSRFPDGNDPTQAPCFEARHSRPALRHSSASSPPCDAVSVRGGVVVRADSEARCSAGGMRRELFDAEGGVCQVRWGEACVEWWRTLVVVMWLQCSASVRGRWESRPAAGPARRTEQFSGRVPCES